MAFYIMPPTLNVDLSSFQSAALSRYKYLHEMASCSGSAMPNCETVIANTSLDNISHYILKCFTVFYPDADAFILKGETDLFSRRLRLQTSEQMSDYAKILKEEVKQVISLEIGKVAHKLFVTIEDFYSILAHREVTSHLVGCIDECGLYYIKVPFEMCLSLVRTRRVELKEGVATVTCGKWKDFLKETYQTHYVAWQNIIRTSGIYEAIKNDERWIRLFHKLVASHYKLYRSIDDVNGGELVHSVEINELSRYFPPCMRSLHNTLRKNHRLHHNARYTYSLFLKDIGMPMTEAMKFWQREYSKPIANQPNCVHTWSKEVRRYSYSIRHLYGHEGSRIVRSAKHCAKMQDMSLALREEGGCPFVHYDNDSLLECISQKSQNVVQDITKVPPATDSSSSNVEKRIMENVVVQDITPATDSSNVEKGIMENVVQDIVPPPATDSNNVQKRIMENIVQEIANVAATDDSGDVEKRIMEFVSAGKPSKACELYMRSLTNTADKFRNDDKSVLFRSPVNYYFQCKKSCSSGVCDKNQW